MPKDSTKPPDSELPDSERRQTRPGNANAHPGRVLLEAKAVRRTREVIDEEKKARKKQHQQREGKKTQERAAIIEVADFENEMALDAKEGETQFPRRQNKLAIAPNKAKKRKTSKVADPEVSDIDDDQPQLKKQRSSTAPKPLCGPNSLRRTETCIVIDSDHHLSTTSPDLMYDNSTPRQKKGEIVDVSESEYRNSQVESEDNDPEFESEDFETPKVLKRVTRKLLLDEDFAETTDTDKADDTESDTQSKKQSGSKKHSASERTIDLTKVQKAVTKKDKRAFRREVEVRRVAMKEESRKVPTVSHDASERRRTTKDTAKARNDAQSTYSEPKTVTMARNITSSSEVSQFSDSKDMTTSRNKTKSVPSKNEKPAQPHTYDDARVAIRSRSSATTGNAVGVTPATAVGKVTNSKSKKASVPETAKASDRFSDEDDTVERATILESPPKGIKRLSSESVVKIQKTSSGSNESRKSRSRKVILRDLSEEVMSGWSKYIEPNFIYCYFYELSPWPTTDEIETCAQKLWDWRFGDSNPLSFARSPSHVQLLNQRLCEVRNQSSSSAIVNLDLEFRLANDIDSSDLFPEEIKEGRQQYAIDLMKDKSFIFGKYTVAEDGKVSKSQPYQGKILLRTFATSFKYIKDVDTDKTDAPLPVDGFPKTLLAIAAAAVERALKLTIDNDYDFEANKVIPKPDPSHATKMSTSVLAFGESIWEPRARFYLEKGILKMKEKDWKNIMKAVADNAATNPFLKKKSRVPVTEEEGDLAWDSESE